MSLLNLSTRALLNPTVSGHPNAPIMTPRRFKLCQRRVRWQQRCSGNTNAPPRTLSMKPQRAQAHIPASSRAPAAFQTRVSSVTSCIAMANADNAAYPTRLNTWHQHLDASQSHQTQLNRCSGTTLLQPSYPTSTVCTSTFGWLLQSE